MNFRRWRSYAVGLICLPIIVVAAVAMQGNRESPTHSSPAEATTAAAAIAGDLGKPCPFCNDEVYLAGDAVIENVDQLGAVLKNFGFFEGQGVAVRLESRGERDSVSFVVSAADLNDEATEAKFREIGAAIIAAGFSRPLTIHLCRKMFVAEKTIEIE